jgi:LysW-gamma-L-lysine carboxypeptidase
MDAPAPPFDLFTRAGVRGWLERVVATPSFSGGEATLVADVVATLAPYAREAFVDAAGNAVAVVGDGPRAITLLCHLDTAPGTVPVRWEGDTLYGRGSVDAKGSAVAMAVAMVRASARVRGAFTIRWVGAVEEESPSSRGARYALRAYPKPDHLLVGEPSGADAVTLGYKGAMRSTLHAEAPTAHGARPELNAIESLLDSLQVVRAWTREATPGEPGVEPRWFERVQLSVVSVNTHDDGLTQRACATLAWRLPPAWPPARLAAAFDALPLAAGVVVEHALATAVPAVRATKDGALARAFRGVVRAAGRTPSVKVKTGTADWNVVASPEVAAAEGALSVWDCDALAYGPGDANLDHTPNEHLEFAELEVAIETLVGVLERLAEAR